MDETGDLLVIWTSGLTVEDTLPAILQFQELKRRTAVDQSVEGLIERGQKFRDLAASHIQYCKGSVFFVIENLGNLLNDDWGVFKEASFPRMQAVVDASLNADGTYTYNNFRAPAGQSLVADASVWTMRLGVKYKF